MSRPPNGGRSSQSVAGPSGHHVDLSQIRGPSRDARMASQAVCRWLRRPDLGAVRLSFISPGRPAGYCRGGVCGSTRHAPARRSPYCAQEPAPGPRPRQRGHHPGARARRTRGRGGSPARVGDVVGPHEVPGRRAAGARGARPHQGRRHQHRGEPQRTAQAAGRGRDDPGQDRGPGHLAPRPARRGRRGHRLGQEAQAGDARGRRCRGCPGGGHGSRARGRSLARAQGGAAVGRGAPAGQPVPGAGLQLRREEQASWTSAGRLGAAHPAAQVVRERRQRSRCLHGTSRAVLAASAGWTGADAAPGRGGRRCRGRSPDLPARRRAGSGKDGPGPARRAGGERLSAARGRAQRRQDQLGTRGGSLDTQARCHRDPRGRRDDRRLRRHRDRELRGARPARRMDRRPRLPRHGRRRGALHQEQGLPALASTCCSSPSGSGHGSRGRC